MRVGSSHFIKLIHLSYSLSFISKISATVDAFLNSQMLLMIITPHALLNYVSRYLHGSL